MSVNYDLFKFWIKCYTVKKTVIDGHLTYGHINFGKITGIFSFNYLYFFLFKFKIPSISNEI